MKTLIKGGTIVTATEKFVGDILVDGETIAMIGTSIDVPVDETIDATGRLVVPGGIDVHTHLDMPFGGAASVDDFETGTIAAAHGGTTCIVDFAIAQKGGSLREAFDTWSEKAAGRAVIDYGFHMIMSDFNEDIGREMGDMVREGVTSFKMFMAYPGVFFVDDGGIFRAMQRSGEIGATISMHAENGLVIDVLVEQALKAGHTDPKYHGITRPPRAEAEATHRAICLAEMADVPVYIVHLSAAEALEQVTAARNRGLEVYAETCPQYLFLSEDNYLEEDFGGAKYVMSPPLRAKEKQKDLWRGLRFNDLQVVATDHCPFCFNEEKQLGRGDFSKIPNGAPGVEHRMTLLHDGGVLAGHIDVNRWVELTATAPAKIFGLFPKKGTLAPGSDADIVIFDGKKEKIISAQTHHMNVDYSCYEGRRVVGQPVMVMSRGKRVIDNENFVGEAGRGNYVKRKPRQ